MKKEFIYRGNKTNEISFPLGGIGSGCIGLACEGTDNQTFEMKLDLQ